MQFKHILLCLSAILGFSRLSFAQGGCLEQGTNIFILQLEYPSEWKVKKEPEIILVNEDSIPYLNPAFVHYDRVLAGEPQKFLRNTQASIKVKHPGQVWQYRPALPEDVFTINISEKKNQFYLARIKIKHDKSTDTFYYHLPKGLSVNICSSGLDTLDDVSDLNRYSDVIKIIHIDLSKPSETRMVSPEPTQFLFKYDYDPAWENAIGDELSTLRQIRVYDAATLALVQVISTPLALPGSDTELPNRVQAIHLDPNRKSPDIPDLKVVIEEKFDEHFNRSRQRCIFYRYDPLTISYTADSILSQKWDVGFDAYKNIIAYDQIIDGNKRHIDTYRFIPGQGWVFSIRKTTYDVPQGGNDIPVTACLSADIPENIMAEVVIRKDKYASGTFVDSIPIYNPCYQKIGLIAEKTEANWEIICPKYLSANDTSWIKIRHAYHASYQISRFNLRFELILQDQSRKVINYSYFNVWDSTMVVNPSNTGSQHFIEIPEKYLLKQPITINSLEIYPDGKPKAYGEVIYGDHQKVGRWEIWDSISNVAASKWYGEEFIISILNPTHLNSKPLMYAYVGGAKVPIRCFDYYRGTDFKVWLPKDMDSLRIESGKAIFEGSIDKATLSNYSQLYFYLLNPDEQYVRQGYNKIPITWDSDAYVLLWDYADPAYAAAGNNAGKILSARIKARFPDLMLFIAPDGTDAYFPTIMFTNQSPTRRTEILNFLINDPLIDVVSRKVQYDDEMQTFHFNTITVGINVYQNNQFVQDLADRYGAHLSSIYGSGNLYEFRFSNLVIDESWTKKLEALYHEKGVELVSPSLYSPVVLDGE